MELFIIFVFVSQETIFEAQNIGDLISLIDFTTTKTTAIFGNDNEGKGNEEERKERLHRK